MEYINLKTLMIEITDILAENKSLKNEVKGINELLEKNNNLYLTEIRDKNKEKNSLKNEIEELNELFLSQNRELKKMLNKGVNY